MTDETNTEGGRGGGSNPISSATPQTSAPIPTKQGATESDAVAEARIIEETVIPAEAPVQRAEEKKSVPPLPPPTPLTMPPLPPPPPREVKSEIPPAPPRAAVPAPVPETLSTPQPEAPDAVHLPKADIKTILGSIQLPERRLAPEEKPKSAPTYDTSLASALSSIEETKKESATTPESSQDSPAPEASTLEKATERLSSIVAPLRTLKNDFQDIVREKKMSLVRAAALEQDKKRDDYKYASESSPQSHRSFGIIFAAVLLALLGSAAFFGVAIVMQGQRGATAPPSDTSFLFAESAFPLSLDNRSALDIKEVLTQIRSGSGTVLGSITRIVPVMTATSLDISGEREVTLEEFLTALNAQVSPELIRALGSEFFLGIHTVDENAPLLVIPVSSYERAFAGMLEWESTMNADLAPAFTAVYDLEVGADGLLAKRQFRDVVMRNYDVRALTDDAGTVQLYYSFPTRNILIIAESQFSFAEVLSRLRAERKL